MSPVEEAIFFCDKYPQFSSNNSHKRKQNILDIRVGRDVVAVSRVRMWVYYAVGRGSRVQRTRMRWIILR